MLGLFALPASLMPRPDGRYGRLASVEGRLQLAIQTVPVASPFDLILEWQPTWIILNRDLDTYFRELGSAILPAASLLRSDNSRMSPSVSLASPRASRRA